jgi:NTE family protein
MLEPDVLVLAGGGVLGEAWMSGVVGGIEDGAGVDLRAIESFVGTSAGSIVCARLAAGRRVRRPQAPDNGAAEAASIAEHARRAALSRERRCSRGRRAASAGWMT